MMALRVGRYRVLRCIASGGMATVSLGRVVGAGGFERLVAIKEMHPHLAHQEEFVEMFLDEARIAALIHHPNVVATLDVQRDDEGVFLVMEYIEGAALSAVMREALRRGKRLPLPITLRILLDTLAGMHAAHELTGPDHKPLHVVHRDISPQNILVGLDGIARITDFGVARAEARLASTKNSEIKGKLSYMAPEQIRREPIDRRLDIYAAGVVLWEALAGELLVGGDSEIELMMKVAGGALRPIPQGDALVPAAIEAACARALSADRGERYPTAVAFDRSLKAAAAEAGVPIASAAEVAAFMEALGIHQFPQERGAAPVSTLATDSPLATPEYTAQHAVHARGAPTRPSLPLGRRPSRRFAMAVAVTAAALGVILLTSVLKHGGLRMSSAGRVTGMELPRSADHAGPTPSPPPAASASAAAASTANVAASASAAAASTAKAAASAAKAAASAAAATARKPAPAPAPVATTRPESPTAEPPSPTSFKPDGL